MASPSRRLALIRDVAPSTLLIRTHEGRTNMLNKTKKSLLIASLAASLGVGMVSVASAQDHHDYHHVSVTVGWHGDRYYDGHRYWERREWERHHPVHHEPPPPHRY
jgi:hypothetical protein